jgi:integrase
MPRRSVVTIYVRHTGNCPYKEEEASARCNCPKFLRWSVGGKQYRQAAHTRSWGIAEEKQQELQRRLDQGEKGQPQAVPTERPTIAQALETYLTAKETEGITPARIKKLKLQIGRFDEYMATRAKFYPVEITAKDVIEFRAGWNHASGMTKQKAQQNLRGFLRYCCRENLPELLAALKTIKLSKADKTRLEPKPFTEHELKQLLAQVPKSFGAPRASKLTALIHTMVSTGLAIRDTVQLERDSIKDGWLRIERQKTGKAVRQKLDRALCIELAAVANGHPKYIFWDGVSKATSATGTWQKDLKELMQSCGLWIKGNLSHRFRDTAVDFWLGQGCSLTDVAAMLGDTVAVVERHYANLASKRMEERLAKMPARKW